MVTVRITPEARRYIAARSPHVTVFLAELKVQCCVPYSPPQVRTGLPDDSGDEYLTMALDDLTVHLPRSIAKHQQELTITLTGFGPFKSLGLEGWRAFGVVSP